MNRPWDTQRTSHIITANNEKNAAKIAKGSSGHFNELPANAGVKRRLQHTA